MNAPLKEIYSESFYDSFSKIASKAIPKFDSAEFKTLIFSDAFHTYELKDRMRHTARVLHHFLSDDFDKAMGQIKLLIECLKTSEMKDKSLEFMFFPDYIARFGLDHFERSVDMMKYVTPFTSCEFAVRPFLLKYDGAMLNEMQKWSEHPDHHVRRLASEGSRPRLPWAEAIPALKKDPSPLLPILDNLKQDNSEYVRRSVANNVNDISKDNPAVVKEIAGEWMGISPETNAIVKHGCRTLLKQGDPHVLKLFGFYSDHLICTDFLIHTPEVLSGDDLKFSFTVENSDNIIRNVRLEYGVYYRKKKGALSKKVFKISERDVEPGTTLSIDRKQSFRPVTTRTYYPGEHKLSVIINGHESILKSFVFR